MRIEKPAQLRLGIVGGGRAAWAFGATWRRIGWPVAGIATRAGSTSHIDELLSVPRSTIDDLSGSSDLLLLAVSDRSIESVARGIPSTNAIVFHVSGSLAHVRDGFSLHPLKVLPAPGEPVDLTGALFVFEGNHRDIAERVVTAIGGRLVAIDPSQKSLYHAAAVFGANYAAAILDISHELLQSAGIDAARESVAELARSAVDNWLAHEDERRFTGPAARGDDEVIARHLQALTAKPEIAEIYRLLAAHIRASILAARK